MKRVRILSIGALLAIVSCNYSNKNRICTNNDDYIQPSPVIVVDTTQRGLRLYYPQTDSVNLRCFERPVPDVDSTILFCYEAIHKHTNIAGDHMSGGTRFKGCPCKRNSGAFVFYDKRWKFLHNNYAHELDSAAMRGVMGFGQELIIFNGDILKTTRTDNNVNLFRALCEKGRQLCIADATYKMAFGDFKQALLDAGVSNAIYTDMGEGWNYSWYREYPDSTAEYIHPEYQKSATNWIVFFEGKNDLLHLAIAAKFDITYSVDTISYIYMLKHLPSKKT